MELVEPPGLLLARCHDDLAAAEHRDAALVAVREQPRRTDDAEPSLERAWHVVDAAVDDPARATGLVRAHCGLLVEHRDPCTRPTRLELSRHGEPKDPGAHDGDVVLRAGHGSPGVAEGKVPG